MIDLQQFCGLGDIRTHINTPFDFDGYRIGTDGWLLVAIPHDTRGIPNTPDLPKGIQADLSDFVIRHLGEGTRVPACDLKMPDLRPCIHCNSTGRMWQTLCATCRGTGEIEKSPGVWSECLSCAGEGCCFSPSDIPLAVPTKEVHCRHCMGAGKIGKNSVKIGSVGFSASLISRLQVLPELRFFPDSESRRADFIFADGGIGMLMGLKIEADVAGGAA